jgi:hypothetical protein
MEELYYSWDKLQTDAKVIISEIHSSGWFPDAIVGVKRGGLVPSVTLSHYMNLPLLVCSCQNRDGEDAVNLLEVDSKWADKRLLIVDDICDEGETFKKISNELLKNKIYDFKTCAIFLNIRQSYPVDFKARKIDRFKDKRWIVFPWEI